MVQNAIANMQDPTQKAATAMEIFGRAGGDLMALFEDSGAIEKASVTMGSSAEILRKNSETFDRISDLLNRASVKFQGIILALAEVAAPKILAALEQFNKMDFAGIGQRFLAGLDVDGAKTLLLSAVKVVAAFLGNKWIQAIRIAASLFEVAYKHVSAKITGEFGQQLMKAAKDAAEVMLFLATGKIGQAMAKIQIATGKTMGEQAKTLEEKMMAAQKAFKDKVTKDEDPFGFKKAAEELDKAMSDIMAKGKEKIEKQKEEEKAEENRKKDETPATQAPPKPAPKPTTPAPEPAKKPPAPTDKPPTAAETQKREAEARKRKEIHDQRVKMQRERLSGVSLRSNNSLSQDRKRLEIASGLKTGGLGTKRYTNPAREAARIAKEQKKDTRDQTEILRDVDRKLEQGLTVD